MATSKKSIPALIIIVAVTGAFYLATIRPGHDWGGDFSQYIHHAKNIAEGSDYEDIGYVYNPYYPHLAPETYPPVFPLMLSPIYKLLGLNFTAMKVELILIFLITLIVLFFVFKNDLPPQHLLILIAIIAFNPYFWNFKDSVLSDLPFLLFTYLALLYTNKAYQSPDPKRPKLLYALIVGLLICLAYGTRSLGIVLVPAVLIYELIRFKRPTRFVLVVALIFIFYAVLQSLFIHSDRSYFGAVAFSSEAILYRVFLDTRPLSLLFDNAYAGSVRSILFVVVTLFAVVGYISRIRQGLTIFELFPPLYLLPLLAIPAVYGTRYLIPVIPLYIFYALVGIDKTSPIVKRNLQKPVFLILTAAVFLSYAARYTRTNFGPLPEGVAKRPSVELFDYIRQNTGENDVFIFRKPRVLSLFTGRPASVYHITKDEQQLWDHLLRINAKYLILGRPFIEDRLFLITFTQNHADRLEHIYHNADFVLFKIKDAPPPKSE